MPSPVTGCRLKKKRLPYEHEMFERPIQLLRKKKDKKDKKSKKNKKDKKVKKKKEKVSWQHWP